MKARSSGGFVSLDVLWILILLGLVVVLSMRGIGLVESREIAERLGNELEMVAEAVDAAAAAGDLEVGDAVKFGDYAPFLDEKAPKRLREEGLDQLGGQFGTQRVGRFPQPDEATARSLGEFWHAKSGGE